MRTAIVQGLLTVIMALLLASCAAFVTADTASGGAVSVRPATDAGGTGGLSAEEFYRQRIGPLLAENCLRCHGPRKQRNGLRLDSRAAVLHGGHVVDVVPTDPDNSRLIDAVSYEDGELQMPPDGKLSDAEIADLTTWIRLGVPWSE